MTLRLRRIVLSLAVFVIALAALTAFPMPQKAEALSGSQFNPGNIISDAVFYDSSTMSEGDIQSFLNSQVPNCASGYTCLKNYSENTNARGADSLCSAYPGGNRSAASILYSVARSCGINPQVLLVMLQKEQGLVTATSPSTSRFTIAMGYACPDTAPCDTTYYGFFNQMYSAAHQLKNYQANPSYWSYRAGRVNTIYWHPNASCGTSQVFIENQATAALYIYTPYRPNQAALDNLYGSGDSCSSYGNRNFWRYFSDWFGDSLAGGSLIKSDSSPKVYVTNAGTKYYVPDVDTLNALAPLGPVRTVSQADVDRLSTGPNAGRALYNQGTGDVYFAEGGRKYHAPSCELLAEYGASCGQLLSLSTRQLGLFGDGPELTGLVKAPASATVYYLADGKKYPVVSWSDAIALAGRGDTNYLQLSATWIAAKPTGKSVLGPSRLVKTADNPMVYLIDGLTSKIPVPSFDIPAELGVTGYSTVDKSVLDGYTAASASLTSNPTCGGANYIGGSGRLWQVASLNGLPSTPVDQRTCNALTVVNYSAAPTYFVQQSGQATVYLVQSNTKRPISSMDAVFALSNGAQPLYVQLSASAAARIPTGAEALGPSLLVKSPNASQVFFVDGLAQKIPVPAFSIPAEMGRTGYLTVSQAALDAYPTAAAGLNSNLTCGGATYFGGAGALWSVKSTNGLPTTAVDPLTCAALPHAGTAAQDEFFIKTANDPAAYWIENGRKRSVSSASIIPGLVPSNSFQFVTVSASTMGAIPTGLDILPPAGRVKASTSNDVFFVATLGQKVRVTSFDLLADLGQTSYLTLPGPSIDSYPTAGSLMPILKSGSTYYLAADGRLSPLSSADGFGVAATTIDARTLLNLGTLGPQIGGKLFVKSTTSDTVYVIEAGGRRAIASLNELISVNGGTMPNVYTLRPDSVAMFPAR